MQRAPEFKYTKYNISWVLFLLLLINNFSICFPAGKYGSFSQIAAITCPSLGLP
jgi:hypothetical protein